ncbi:hypothetical protein LguiA_029478 [Lonicera macranthoides]
MVRLSMRGLLNQGDDADNKHPKLMIKWLGALPAKIKGEDDAPKYLEGEWFPQAPKWEVKAMPLELKLLGCTSKSQRNLSTPGGGSMINHPKAGGAGGCKSSPALLSYTPDALCDSRERVRDRKIMGSINVPLGFRFVPTDQELMEFLFNKVHGCPLPSSSAIPEVDVYGYHPSFLAAGDDDVDEEKFYFVKMKRLSKNKNGKRPSRTQEGLAYAYDDGTIGVGGWWKATTGTKDIYSEGGGNRKRTRLGFKRTLKFYNFKNKNKERSQATGTDWIMHEYNLNNSEVSDDNYLIQFFNTS